MFAALFLPFERYTSLIQDLSGLEDSCSFPHKPLQLAVSVPHLTSYQVCLSLSHIRALKWACPEQTVRKSFAPTPMRDCWEPVRTCPLHNASLALSLSISVALSLLLCLLFWTGCSAKTSPPHPLSFLRFLLSLRMHIVLWITLRCFLSTLLFLSRLAVSEAFVKLRITGFKLLLCLSCCL